MSLEPVPVEPVPVEPVRVVGAAVLRTDPDGVRRVLASRRTEPPRLAGRWEFPGGKVEPGETDEQALVRELAEELGVGAMVGDRLGGDLAIGATAVLRVFLATVDGEPQLRDHDAHRWLAAHELDDVGWLPVDLPLVGLLREVLLLPGLVLQCGRSRSFCGRRSGPGG